MSSKKSASDTFWGTARTIIPAALICAGLWSCSGGGQSSGTDDVGNANRPPVAFNQQAQVAVAGDIELRVLSASFDPDYDLLQIVYFTQPVHGAVTLKDSGTPDNPHDDYLLYACDPVFVGVVSFQYTISDGRSGRATGTVEITIGNAGNNPPVTVSDYVDVPQNGSIAIDVMINDSDPDGDEISIAGFGLPIFGSVVLDDAGTAAPGDDRLVYTPPPAYTGLDSFVYAVTDGSMISEETVNVTVGAAGPTEEVCGNVMKGAVQQSVIRLLPIDGSGQPSSTTPVAMAITDPAGFWCAQVPLPREALLVQTSGGFFIDETDTNTANRRTITLAPEDGLEAVLPEGQNFVTLNVFTNAMLIKSRDQTTNDEFAALYAINRGLFNQAFGWDAGRDVLTTLPADPAFLTTAADADAKSYSMVLGGIANVVNGVAVRFAESEMSFDMIEGVILDLTDCLLDGHHYVDTIRAPTFFMLNGSTAQIPDDLDLNIETIRFRNNNQTEFIGVPLTQIDGSVCLGGAGDVDGLAPVFVFDPVPPQLIPATGPLTDLLAAIDAPTVADNLDPSPSVEVVTVATSTGTPLSMPDPLVEPGEYDVTWRATDFSGNIAERVQRIVVFQGNDGTIALNPVSLIPGQMLWVSVSDPDVDINPVAADSVVVSVTNLLTAESESLILTETGSSTGLFTGTLTTEFGVAAGLDDNGIIAVQAGDTLEGRYDDATDSTGAAVSVTDTAAVSGGATGAITVSPAAIIPGDVLAVAVIDADLNTNAAVAESATATVINTVTGESETLTLTETGVNTGVYTAGIVTIFGIVAGADDDGTLVVQATNTVQVGYADLLDAIGGPATVTDTSVVNGGATGTILLTSATIVPGDTLTVTVSDADLDTNPAIAESASANLINTVTLESEALTLIETGVNTGVFTMTLATAFGTAAGADDDGTLVVQATDTAQASYTDSINAAGGPATVTDSSAVDGGATGAISAAPATIQPGDTLTVTVTDADLDTAPAVAESATAIVINNVTLESEALTLTETGLNTGVFAATLATSFGIVAGADDDGTLVVQATDTAQASYDDAMDGAGGPATVTDTGTVNGGTTGTVAITTTVRPGDTLTVTVTDADLDTNPAVAESAMAIVINTVTLESEALTLTETGLNTGVFAATLATSFGFVAGTDDDGSLVVQATDTAQASYDDAMDAGGGPATLTASSAVNGGTTGAVAIAPATIQPGDTLTVTVTDADLDTNPAVAESAMAIVINTVTLESEALTLTETGLNTGVFAATLATSFGFVAGTDDDGTLVVQATDTAQASYDDAMDAGGGPATLTASSAVNGGTTGAVAIAPATIQPGDTLTVTVTDADLDTNPAVADTASATVINTGTLESESLTLTETGLTTGIFTATMASAYGTVAGVDDDGTLLVQAGDTAQASYNDAMNATGGPATVTDMSAVNGGTTGSISIAPTTIVPGDTVTVTVSDADLNANPGVAESASATVINSVTLESESMVLTETGINTGVFAGTLPTAFGTGAGADEDGTLVVQATDTAQASYIDTMDAGGGPATVTNTSTVIGGTSGTISMTPAAIMPGDTLTITVADADLDADSAVVEMTTATVINTITLESEAITLTETGPNTGVFTTTLATAFGTVAGADDDGTLVVQAGETAEASYEDALDASGGPATVTDTSMVNGGITGSVAITPATILPGDTLTITVTDADLDANPAVAESAAATVINTVTLESEALTLTETGVNTGVFATTLATTFGTVAGTGDDGILVVQAGDSAQAGYDDAIDSTGGPATTTDSSTVAGGATGTLELAPGAILPGESITVTVIDADLDTNLTVAETVDLSVVNLMTSEFETVTLTETGVSTGIFTSVLATNSGSGGADDDGTLDILSGDTVEGSYDDAMDASGGPVTVTASIPVFVPGDDTDGDGIGDATEALITGDPVAAQSGLFFVDPDPSIVVRDGTSWATAYRDIKEIVNAPGAPIPAGASYTAPVYVAIADTRGYAGTGGEWKISVANGDCSHIAFIGSLADGQVDPNPIIGITTELNVQNAQILDATNCANLQFHYIRFTQSGGPAIASGGAIRLATSDAVFDTVRFDGNEAAVSGGALYLGNTPAPTVIRWSSFEDNQIQTAGGIGGGAIYLANNGWLQIEDSRFIHNSAEPASGGALYAVQSSEFSITRSVFAGNSAIQRGGAIYADRNNVSAPSWIEHSLFSGNDADVEGGAGYFFCNDFAPPLRFFNNLVSGNAAPRGGAVAIDDCDAIQFDNNTFVFNQADAAVGGGAFHIDTTSIAAPNFRPMPEIYDNLLFGNIDQGGTSVYSINNLSSWGAQQSHENVMDDPGSVTTKDVLMVDHTLEFDVAYYLDQLTSSAIDLSLTNASNASKFGTTPNRTTDQTGAADSGKADSAYHYETNYRGDVASAATSSTLIGDDGPRGQLILVGLYNAGSELVGGGYRVAFEVDPVSAPVILRNPSDAPDPLVPVAHVVATDLGTGEYELVVSTDGVPGPDSVTLHVYVDGIFIDTVVIPIT